MAKKQTIDRATELRNLLDKKSDLTSKQEQRYRAELEKVERNKRRNAENKAKKNGKIETPVTLGILGPVASDEPRRLVPENHRWSVRRIDANDPKEVEVSSIDGHKLTDPEFLKSLGSDVLVCWYKEARSDERPPFMRSMIVRGPDAIAPFRIFFDKNLKSMVLTRMDKETQKPIIEDTNVQWGEFPAAMLSFYTERALRRRSSKKPKERAVVPA